MTNCLVVRHVLTSVSGVLPDLLSFMFNEAEHFKDLAGGELGHGVLQ